MELAQHANETGPVAAAPAAPGRRVRFALSTLILGAALIAACAMLVASQMELQDLREQNHAYRDELGILTIQDPSKIHVLAIRQDDPYAWSWRIHLPEPGSYRIHWCAGSQIAEKDTPALDDFLATAEIEAGSSRIDLKVRKTEADAWELVLAIPGCTYRGPIPVEALAWMNSPYSVRNAGSTGTEIMPRGEPVELLRLRQAWSQATPPANGDYRTPGLLVWITEAP